MEQLCKEQILQQRQIDSIECILRYNSSLMQSASELVFNGKDWERIQQQPFNSYQDYVFTPFIAFESLRKHLQGFASERNWDKNHIPRNLLLALQGELGELAELFQWKGEVECGLKGFSYEERVRVGEELSDCFSYLVRLADKCRIDLCRAIERKYIFNGIKYPPKSCEVSDSRYRNFSHISYK